MKSAVRAVDQCTCGNMPRLWRSRTPGRTWCRENHTTSSQSSFCIWPLSLPIKEGCSISKHEIDKRFIMSKVDDEKILMFCGRINLHLKYTTLKTASS